MITSQLFEAYLACPTKCFLKSLGESSRENAYANGIETRRESYCQEGVTRLPPNTSRIVDVHSLRTYRLMPQWYVLDHAVCTQNLEANIHAVERIPPQQTPLTSLIVPIRFVQTNKLTRVDKLVSGFEAHVLSKATGKQVRVAKILYGDNWSTFRLKTDSIAREVGKIIQQVADLLSTSSPPKLVLNRHCPKCMFRDYCRKRALEKDDLSLLETLKD